MWHGTRTGDRERESLFWLQFGVLAVVILDPGGCPLGARHRFVDSTPPRRAPPPSATSERLKLLFSSSRRTRPPGRSCIRAQALSGDTRAASRSVERADTALGTRRGPVGIEVARIAFLEEDFEAALEEIDAALAIVAEETEAERKSLAERNIVMDPDFTAEIDARVLKGEILTAAGDAEGAIDAYTEALEFNGRMADVLLARGLLYEELGQAEEARADFEAALTYIPDYAPALEALDRIGG